jgi:murein DD-endopeptidase MepM/ murein hydrolase activator NlpD
MRIALDPQTKRRGWAAPLALVLLLCALVLGIQAGPAPGKSLQEQLDAKQGQLDEVMDRKGVVTSEISRYTDRIIRLEGEVAALRNREADVQDRLDAKEAQLERAEDELQREKEHLLAVRAHLKRALVGLRDRLVSIYKSGSPDVLTVLLESDGWSDLVTRSEYVERLKDQDGLLVERVRDLRNEARAVVDRLRTVRDRIETARDAIAAHKLELEQARAAVESRQGDLEAARGKRRDLLAQIADHQEKLEGDLSEISGEIAAQLGGSATALPAGPIQGGSSGMIWPVNGAVVSGFGMRWGRMHEGVDIAAPAGTPIRAARSGTIVMAGPSGGYGNYTCIDHGGGLSTCYAHQSSFAITSGAVGQGQIIGYVGCTGHCFGDHLHFEVRINGAAVDPMGYL